MFKDIIIDYYDGMPTADIARKYNVPLEEVVNIIGAYKDGEFDDKGF